MKCQNLPMSTRTFGGRYTTQSWLVYHINAITSSNLDLIWPKFIDEKKKFLLIKVDWCTWIIKERIKERKTLVHHVHCIIWATECLLFSSGLSFEETVVGDWCTSFSCFSAIYLVGLTKLRSTFWGIYLSIREFMPKPSTYNLEVSAHHVRQAFKRTTPVARTGSPVCFAATVLCLEDPTF